MITQKWFTTNELAVMWNYSRQQIWRLRHEMQAVPRFAAGVRGRRKGLRFNGEIFEDFMSWSERKV
ncbi:hypothetical protein [Dialister micraerophilus]|uniref:hypothetical protein n=1 Tax=Dialister micraerophilus TaxID=309120 RepID=UPI0023F2B59E|nr:hypothetical protein [Dialister micraerophilus]